MGPGSAKGVLWPHFHLLFFSVDLSDSPLETLTKNHEENGTTTLYRVRIK